MENTTHNTNTSYRQNVIYILFLDKTFVPFSQAKLKKHSIWDPTNCHYLPD